MEILVLGCSSVFLRRVLPALNACKFVTKIHVASKGKPRSVIEICYSQKIDKWFSRYSEALNALKASPSILVYITLPNYLHYEWAEKCLLAGYHVVVEKPAVLKLSDAQYLCELATSKSICFAEATVWPYHPQIEFVRQILRRKGQAPASINATFSVPSFNDDNFRNNILLGGGVFNDMSAYAASIGRVFFEVELKDVSSQMLNVNASTGLDEVFKINAWYSNGQVLEGLFGFGLDYVNCLSIVGSGFNFNLTRVFSPPAEITLPLYEFSDKIKKTHQMMGNAYLIFFNQVIESVHNGTYSKWSNLVLEDQIVVDKMREELFRKEI